MAKSKVTPIWRKEARTDHIYRVAAGIMCRKGYEATSMNDIADAVGLTKAAMYHYIQGKEHLLFEIMSFAMDMVDQNVIGPAIQNAFNDQTGEQLNTHLLLGVSVSGIQLNAQKSAPPPDQQAQPPAQRQAPDQSGQQAPDAQAQSPQTEGHIFSGTIVKSGDKLVLQDTSGTTYDIDRQDLAKKYEGKQVRINGTLDPDGKTIHVK